MTYETKDNTGSLFKNNRKEKDTHPDYTGSARIDGHDVWMSAWLKKDKNGNSYMSFAFKRKDGTAARPDPAAEFKGEARRVFGGGSPDLDDAVPFSPEFR